MSPEKTTTEWWKGLSSGDKAELRRAKSITEILLTPAANRLRWQIKEEWRNPSAIALIAGVLANVKTDDDHSFPARLGQFMSDLRFRRLIGTTDREQLLVPMIRAVRLADAKANIGGLATSLYWWNDRTRREWAYDYYSKHEEAHA